VYFLYVSLIWYKKISWLFVKLSGENHTFTFSNSGINLANEPKSNFFSVSHLNAYSRFSHIGILYFNVHFVFSQHIFGYIEHTSPPWSMHCLSQGELAPTHLCLFLLSQLLLWWVVRSVVWWVDWRARVRQIMTTTIFDIIFNNYKFTAHINFMSSKEKINSILIGWIEISMIWCITSCSQYSS
jgi:hypothetical protein